MPRMPMVRSGMMTSVDLPLARSEDGILVVGEHWSGVPRVHAGSTPCRRASSVAVADGLPEGVMHLVAVSVFAS
jgi:hypothetical protein